jgi:hypothetical protein
MAARCQILAALMAAIGQLIGVIGLPLPALQKTNAAMPTAAKAEKKCHCACGGGRGEHCCCCSGETPEADPSPGGEQPWHWFASVQMQRCFGIGPAGFPDLPPGLPMVQSTGYCHIDSQVELIHLSPDTFDIVRGRPPTPPPRAA